MSLLKYFIALIVLSTYDHYADGKSYLTRGERRNVNDHSKSRETRAAISPNRVDVHVYYESLCPFSIDFFADYLEPVILSMPNYIKLHLYPYGNAKTVQKDGKYHTTCQHGEEECYGNKLHACALDIVKNETKAALYITCMMALYSDNDAATQCGKSMNINADSIKECAQSYKGEELLKYYGDLSRKAHYKGVPHVVIGDQKIKRRDLKVIVCNGLANPPPTCE